MLLYNLPRILADKCIHPYQYSILNSYATSQYMVQFSLLFVPPK